MLKKSLIMLGITTAIFVGSACSGPETLSQRNWGKSYETAAYNQTLNLDADKTLKTVEALDARGAMNVHKKYLDDFKVKEKKQTVNFILNPSQK